MALSSSDYIEAIQKGNELAERMALRAIIVVVAQLARPDDPRAYVDLLRQALNDQIPEGPLFPLHSAEFNRTVKEGATAAINDMTLRINWGSRSDE